ncbi:MAG: DUF234 domain-containing protein, partial [Anaerolineales bacterium]|nr:DUF234 domain-containing protein [Anaerolineales bacterium]
YVLPNRSRLERGGAGIILNNQVIPQLDLFTSLAFEDICSQALWSLGLAGKLPFIPKNIGNWWNAHEEIDLVVIGETDVMLVECKWTTKPVGLDILADLERKTKLIVPRFEDCNTRYALCSRSGFTDQLVQEAKIRNDVILFSLLDILH